MIRTAWPSTGSCCRRFYLAEGYADFRVISAIAELTPDREEFFITFTVEEGERYRFGTVDVQIRSPGPRYRGAAERAGDGGRTIGIRARPSRRRSKTSATRSATCNMPSSISNPRWHGSAKSV